MNFYYIGNGAYCYANSTSMMLSYLGEDIPPSIIEPITGVGLSASVEKSGFLFLNNQTLEPDLGIAEALKILGFESESFVSETAEDMPFDELKEILSKQPVILGPLDMGFLVYNPNHQHMHGGDHFVFAYGAKDDMVHLHDPAGFPHVFLDKDNLKKSWEAEKVSYRRGYYRYITNVKRVSSPSKDEIYSGVINRFINIYKQGETNTSLGVWSIGSKALLNTKERLESKHVSQRELDNFKYFVFPLGARRALDFAKFFDHKDADLAELKREQARLLGEAHTHTVVNNHDLLGSVLEQLADVEDKFRSTLLGKSA